MMPAMRKHGLAFVALVMSLAGTVGTVRADIAERGPDEPPLPVDESSIVGRKNDQGMLTGYVFTGEVTIAGGSLNSRLIYLNNCKGETTSTGAPGCRLTRGSNNSITNTSSIASGNLAAYTGSDATWAAILTCVRQTYAPFNVTVTDINPGSAPHFEAMAAGLPGNIGYPSSVGGVSPFSCGIIQNAISFSFLNANPSNVNQACYIIAQETAHAFGLSHEMLAADPMTYIQNPPVKRFQNQLACIGTQGCCQPQQECQCGVQMQNSYQELMDIFGPSTPTPPVITFETPMNGANVSAGFVVRVAVADDQGVASVELLIDNNPIGSILTPPYAFNAPASITPGTHMVTVRATDTGGTAGTASITVNVGDPCTSDSSCSSQGAGLVCVDGRCVPGSDQPGGLGTTCNAATECVSGLCATKDGENRCTENCDLAANACPDGYECLSNGAGGGLCWSSGGGCLGCSSGGGPQPILPIAGGVLMALVLVRRRRATPG